MSIGNCAIRSFARSSLWSLRWITACATISLAGNADAAQLLMNGPVAGSKFGSNVTMVPNCNGALTDPEFEEVPAGVAPSAAYRYRPDGAPMSALVGDSPGAQTAVALRVLSNGNCVVARPSWHISAIADAVTFDSDVADVSGSVSVASSLIGGAGHDGLTAHAPPSIGIPPAELDAALGTDGRLNVFVQFARAPAAQVYVEELTAHAGAEVSTVFKAAASKAQAQHFVIRAEHSAFLERLSSIGGGHDLLYRASRSINGVALRAAPEMIDELRALPGVMRVEVLQPDELQNASSVPFIGAPSVWDNTVGLPLGSTGRGISIGIIDTGIDYQHASFGGTGALADYQTNDRTIVTDANPAARFPTTKVVGGYDFVGDLYDAGSSNVPVPDPDPMDCNGHGSHVAGTAAGYGVNVETGPLARPTPYTGPWNSTTNYAALKIGPGVAPQADLYALRVFGCGGSTAMVVAAIEWAMDPNGDGDMSDHLDVINLSLGSVFGSRFHPSAIAADAAAAVGIVVVAAAGNSGDTTFSVSSPGAAARALSVANIGHAETSSVIGAPIGDLVAGIDLLSSRGPVRSAPIILVKPDVAAPGTNIRSVQTGVACTRNTAPFGCIVSTDTGFVPNSEALVLSGTSMAAPHIAGVAALLRDLYPTLSVEEIKAMIMNRASRDVTTLPGGNGVRYPASRVGAGQVDAARAATESVVLYNDEDQGAVSISFESAVRGTVTRTKRVRLVNYSARNRTFAVSLDTVADAPGVAVSLPDGPIVTVPAHGATTIAVQLDGNANQMDHVREPTRDASININNVEYPLGYVSEESALLKLSEGGAEVLRLPVYALVYPESAMSAPAEIATGGAASGTTTVALSGQGVCTGTLVAGSLCSATPPHDQVSLVSAFELQAVSERSPSLDPAVDVRHIGVAYTPHNDQLHFGISTYGPWASPIASSFSVEIDCGVYTLGANFAEDTCTGAPDGSFDMRLFSTNLGYLILFFVPLDMSVTSVVGLHPTRDRLDLLWGQGTLPPYNFVNGGSALDGNSRLHHNEVQFLSAPRAFLKIDRRFRYRVSSCPELNPLCNAGLDLVGPLTWDLGAQGLNFDGGLRAPDLNDASLTVRWNSTNFAANASLGGLLLHHHNGEGERAEVVVLQGAASGDIGVGMSVSNAAPAIDSIITYGISITNNDADPASAISAVIELPPGIAYVGDTGAGAYTSATGIWSIASLAAGATTTIEVVGRVTVGGPQVTRAVLSTVAPIDVVPTNDQATVIIHGSNSPEGVVFRNSFE